MFPPPNEALPLPQRPNLEHYRKLAKALLKSAKSGEPLDPFAQRQLSSHPTLTKAQFVIARRHGFASWPKFTRHIADLARNSPASRFEAAADAIVQGNLSALRDLLRADPALSIARSSREHGATLLHYIGANGVEDYRQKTPANIVEIAKLLIESGASVDAEADIYGGGSTALELAATSIHPLRAGVQQQLIETLLAHGASLAKPSLLTACLANGRPQAAQFLASRGAPVDLVAAGGLGQLDRVRELLPNATAEQKRDALLWAAEYGRNPVVEFLLEHGADLSAHRPDGQTALHWAVVGGQPDTVRLLLQHKPPLEIENRYGGTPLGQALWSAAHGGDPDIYIEILNALAGAGAILPAECPPIHPAIDAWLQSRGCLTIRASRPT